MSETLTATSPIKSIADDFIIPIDDKLEDFKNHLSYNNKVVLSAKFGDGKT